MTLGFAVLLTMVIIRFRSLQKKHHPTSAHKTRTGRREGKRSHLIRSSSRNQLMRKLSLMRRILNLFPKPPIQHKNSNSLFDTLYLTPSLSLMRIIREPSHHDFKKLKKKVSFTKLWRDEMSERRKSEKDVGFYISLLPPAVTSPL